MRRLAYVLPALLFGAVAAWFLVALVSGRDPSVVPSALLDRPAPEFVLPPLFADQPGVARADLDGRVILVNFFASWCVPCRAEHPQLMQLAEAEGVLIFGIAYKDKPEASRDFLAELGNPYDRIGIDADGRTAIEFGVYGVPESYVIDTAGMIRYREVGPLTPTVLADKILPLIAGLRK